MESVELFFLFNSHYTKKKQKTPKTHIIQIISNQLLHFFLVFYSLIFSPTEQSHNNNPDRVFLENLSSLGGRKGSWKLLIVNSNS